MALIKYSALVSGMSGKLNGSVAARNKGGNYLRNKTTPVNPQSVAQQAARARFGGISTLFRSLTVDQVNSWNAAAQNFPYTNIFGDVSFLNGLQLFTKLNTNLAIAGIAPKTAPPTPEGSGSVILVSAIADVSVQEVSLNIAFDVIDSGDMIVVEATAPVSGNSRFYKNKFRQIGAFAIANVTNSVTIGNAYVAVFGNMPANANVAFRISVINIRTGERSAGSSQRVTF